MVPWFLNNKWHNINYILIIQAMNFIVSHTFREGNFCAYGLANLGLSLHNLTLWYNVPRVIKEHYETT
jgi:hypothetical protein